MKASYDGTALDFDCEGATYSVREMYRATALAMHSLIKDQHAELAALRAEVERLRDCLLKVGFAVAVYDDSSDRWRCDYDASCAGGTLADAVRVVCDEFLPQPPENG